MKRLLLLVLGALLALGLASCGGQTQPSETAAAEKDAELAVSTADYGGAEFHILSAGNIAYNDFDFEEESSLLLPNAQYKRKAKVEADFNIEITETIKEGYSSASSGSSGPGFLAIMTDYTAGDCTNDLALIAGYDVSCLAYSSMLYDMASIPTLDLKNPWWDQNANNSLTVRGVTFFTTGDITFSDNDAVNIFVFNKRLHAEYGIEDLYEAVKNGTWTIAKLGEVVKVVSEDLNNDGNMDENDRFGMLTWDDSICAMISAVGERCCVINGDGNLELTIYNEKTVSAIEAYMAIVADKEHAFSYQRKQIDGTDYWLNEQGLLWSTRVDSVPRFRDMDSDFGILPYPKYDEAQTDYYSCVAPYNSQFICVPLIQNDVERTGVITEALAYYGKEIVLPAYYDLNLIGQSSRDEPSEEMLDIIFDNLVFDIGYFYQIGPYNKELIYMLRANEANFASRYDALKNKANVMLDIINKAYANAVAEWQHDAPVETTAAE